MKGQFAIIPDYLLTEASPAALRVYMALALRTDHTTGVCWPSRATLARTLNVSPRTVTRALHSLVELGAVEVTHRKDEAGDWTSNLYRLPFAISRRGGVVTPMTLPSDAHDPTGSDTGVQGVGSPVSHNPDSSSDSIDPEAINAIPREEGEAWSAYLVRIANLG